MLLFLYPACVKVKSEWNGTEQNKTFDKLAVQAYRGQWWSGPRDNFISAELILHYLYGVIYHVIRHSSMCLQYQMVRHSSIQNIYLIHHSNNWSL